MTDNTDFFNVDFDDPVDYRTDNLQVDSLYNFLKDDEFVFSDSLDGSGAAYIMPDGLFLFLENNRDKLNFTNKITHGSLDYYLNRRGIISDDNASRVLCKSDNAIRINDGSNFSFEVLIGLPQKKPTWEQFNALENWLYYLISKKKYQVQVGDEQVSTVFMTYDLKEDLPEDVVSRIKTYYSCGVLREAKEIKQLNTI